MASGVATTRLKKLHFTNRLNWNCESLVWVKCTQPNNKKMMKIGAVTMLATVQVALAKVHTGGRSADVVMTN